MDLLQQLQQANYSGTALSSDGSVSYQQLIAGAITIRQQHPQLQQQAIALHYTALPQFLMALLAFDGWSSALYLLPETDLDIPELVQHWPSETSVKQHSTIHSTIGSQETRWYLATSGTTGTPKWIAHTFASLSRAVKISVDQRTLHWGLCYQPTRFAGLQVLLQSMMSGACISDCSSGDVEQRIEMMLSSGVTALSATPSLWRQLLMTGRLHQLPLIQLTLGGEIADQALLNKLSALFPSARILHIYASTEVGVGFAVSDQQTGFPLSWLGTKHSGLAFKIDGQQHLWLKPPHSPDSNLAKRLDSEGYLDTGDLVQIQDNRVQFLGRDSGVINVGGNKVHPEQVEQVLLQIADVLQAKVYAKASSVLGQLVVADIVVVANADQSKLQPLLFAHCQQQLARYQIPTRFNFVDSLSTNATGKLSRKEPHG
jgi:acyl-CoA synthetase (AMP-forming)/AMP-acid ligase II